MEKLRNAFASVAGAVDRATKPVRDSKLGGLFQASAGALQAAVGVGVGVMSVGKTLSALSAGGAGSDLGLGLLGIVLAASAISSAKPFYEDGVAKIKGPAPKAA